MTNHADALDTAISIASITGQAGDYLDEARAKRAASVVLQRHNVSAISAYKAFLIATKAGLDSDDTKFPHRARVWLEAESAASAAYVRHWDDPDGTYVEIVPRYY
jgi:hypothetical protein